MSNIIIWILAGFVVGLVPGVWLGWGLKALHDSNQKMVNLDREMERRAKEVRQNAETEINTLARFRNAIVAAYGDKFKLSESRTNKDGAFFLVIRLGSTGALLAFAIDTSIGSRPVYLYRFDNNRTSYYSVQDMDEAIQSALDYLRDLP